MDSSHACLAVINMDSALEKQDNFYLKVFLKDWKTLIRHINDNMSDFSSSDDSDEK